MESPTASTKASSESSTDNPRSTTKDLYEQKSFNLLKIEENSPDLTKVTKTISKADIPRKNYCYVTENVRLELLDAVNNKKEKIKQVARRLGVNYSSAKSICQIFKKEGRAHRIVHKDKRHLKDQKQPLTSNEATAKSLSQMIPFTSRSQKADIIGNQVLSSITSISQDKPSFYVLQPVQVPKIIFASQQRNDNTNRIVFMPQQQVAAQNYVVLANNQNAQNSQLTNVTSARLMVQSSQLPQQDKQIISLINPSNLMPRGIFNSLQPINSHSYIMANSLGVIPQTNIQHQVCPINSNFRVQPSQTMQANSLIVHKSLPDPRFIGQMMKPSLTSLDRERHEASKIQPHFLVFTDPKVQVLFQPK